jgi:hypothetical protein
VTTTPPNETPFARNATPVARSSWSGYAVALVGALVSALYLSNAGAGIVELLPDNLPLAGNLDEMLFTFVLLASLRKLGIDLMPHLRGEKK